MPTYRLEVAQEDNQRRLDVFLTKNLTDIPSRTFVKTLIDSKCVTVNGRLEKAHYKIHTNDAILVEFTQKKQSDVEAQDIALDIFYEDDDLLVVNKPIGMMVHPAKGCYSGTLVNALLFHEEELSDGSDADRPGIVHRLDKETSGLMVVAKNNVAHARLARQFEGRRVEKCYVALVQGLVEFDEGVIDASLGRDPRHHDRKAVRFDDAKEAKTFYRVMKRFQHTTLVSLFPKTGRTHQLRVHMKYLGHPILGDYKYGEGKNFTRLALHARSLGFRHPLTKRYLEFSTRLPEVFAKFQD